MCNNFAATCVHASTLRHEQHEPGPGCPPLCSAGRVEIAYTTYTTYTNVVVHSHSRNETLRPVTVGRTLQKKQKKKRKLNETLSHTHTMLKCVIH